MNEPTTSHKQKLELVEEHAMPPATDAAVRELLCECFPRDVEHFRKRRAWHESVPEYSILAWEDDQVVGHVAVVLRTIDCKEQFRLRVAGIQGVAVTPRLRKTGLSQRLMNLALTEAVAREVPFGLLFCHKPLLAFYRSMGWRRYNHPIVMRNKDGEQVPMRANHAMYIELTEARFPQGPLDLLGRDW
jgi:predicted N-acetyltransferase YhbS